MKRGTAGKLKFKKLKGALSIPEWGAKGILQGLWDFAIDNCPAGDIGRFSDEDIALGIEWDESPSALVNALVDTGWVDRHPESRLVIHNWWQHCEDSIHMALARKRQRFACGKIPKLTRIPSEERKEIERDFSAQETHGHAQETHGHAQETHGHAQETHGHAQETHESTLPKPVPVPVPNPNTGTGKSVGFLREVTNETLGDSGKLLAWYRRHLGRDPGERDQLFVVGAAVRAIDINPNDPVKIFVPIIRDDLRQNISADQEDRGRRILRDWNVRAGPANCDVAASLAESLKPKDAR